MFVKIVIHYLVLKIVLAQFDGNFWWMNKDLNKYHIEPPPPQFEELSEFDTDESAKIVFRDKDYSFSFSDLVIPRPGKSNKEEKALKSDKMKFDIQFQDKSVITFPDHMQQDNYLVEKDKKSTIKANNNNKTTKTSEDVLDFKFPDDNEFWHTINGDKTTRTSSTTTEKSVTNNKKNTTILIKNKTPMQVYKENSETEHICTSMKKIECNRRGGAVYAKEDRESKKFQFETQMICCILPLSNKTASEKTHKIYFPEALTPKLTKRIKRSELESPAMKQRKALLLRKYGPKLQALVDKPTTVKGNHKIVTTEEGYDPYWNIKNSNFKTQFPKPSHQLATKYDYNADDYVEDYVVELPQPGLSGLYSDNSARPPNWSFDGGKPGSAYGGIVDSEEDGGTSFVYPATVDPRLDRIGASRPPIRGRPVKLSIASNENSYDTESQTISYQSNPDFHVLQGYKLLNLVRNRSRIYRNEKKTTTTESVYGDDSKESVHIASVETDYEEIDKNQQVFKDCGRIIRESTEYDDDSNKHIGEAERDSHPWLAMIVLSRKRQSILCYTTIVTPRVAVTTADCVHGKTSPGEITLIAGVWDLSDTTHEDWQKRLVTIHLHTQYRPGDLAHNLALLHWKRPLRLSESVQPACLSDPHVGDDCKFFGWGGYDQAIRQHSRWQRASILTPRACNNKISPSKRADLPSDAFCASIYSRGTVTGIGGPLICTIGNRHSAVGVAVWRDNAVVLIPAHEWIARALSILNL